MMCDPEESEGKMSVSQWGTLALLQAISTNICLFMILFSFANLRYNFVVLSVLSIINILFIKQIFDEKDAPFIQDIVPFLTNFGIILPLIFVFFYFN